MATTTINDKGTAKAGAQVGRSVPRLEAREKVTGRAEYTHTMRLPNMLTAKIFRSTVAHGKIKSIDVSTAKALPGADQFQEDTFAALVAILTNSFNGTAIVRAVLPQPEMEEGQIQLLTELLRGAG